MLSISIALLLCRLNDGSIAEGIAAGWTADPIPLAGCECEVIGDRGPPTLGFAGEYEPWTYPFGSPGTE